MRKENISIEHFGGGPYDIAMTLESNIKKKALELGFDAAGITTAEPVDSAQIEYFNRWLEAGCAAQMEYLHRNIDKRFNPGKLLNGAQSVICVALNYRPKPDELPADPEIRIANFAMYEDYHPFIKERLFQLADFIQTEAWNGSDTMQIKFKACVDSVPLAERALAERAGLGFIGRNHMLISPELGNQILLGELITTVELEPDEPMENPSCGDCGKCIRACPTGALDFDGGFDARKCISYLTIESPDEILAEYKNKLGNRIFGCDACIRACPHETGKPARSNADFQLHPEWAKLRKTDIQNMTQDTFDKTFVNSGLLRTGLEKLKRNSDYLKNV